MAHSGYILLFIGFFQYVKELFVIFAYICLQVFYKCFTNIQTVCKQQNVLQTFFVIICKLLLTMRYAKVIKDVYRKQIIEYSPAL